MQRVSTSTMYKKADEEIQMNYVACSATVSVTTRPTGSNLNCGTWRTVEQRHDGISTHTDALKRATGSRDDEKESFYF